MKIKTTVTLNDDDLNALLKVGEILRALNIVPTATDLINLGNAENYNGGTYCGTRLLNVNTRELREVLIYEQGDN